ncbi:hypothetical protein [Thermohalobacter berrensis]|uniref:Uncharacterized protein n=1 Tax=Thermohalobacter berrensis TaxID=99594 RepID=A0A419T1G5_9FIRM|nr:hypothetical protein [Thermohalobacter berrensis]RKD31261.1 hypothetical protein BET03_03795 [Thermohalobacter berrensis]
MRKNEILIIILISIIIVLSIFNIYQYKKNLEIKIEYGQRIRHIEQIALVIVPRRVLGELQDSNNIDEVGLAETIEHVITAKSFAYSGVRGFSQVTSFLDNTEKDLKELRKLIKQNGKEKEIDILIQKIKKNQEKSLKTYEEIEKFFEGYMNPIHEEKEEEKKNLLWYKNSAGESNELIKIIEEGLK